MCYLASGEAWLSSWYDIFSFAMDPAATGDRLDPGHHRRPVICGEPFASLTLGTDNFRIECVRQADSNCSGRSPGGTVAANDQEPENPAGDRGSGC